MSRPWTSVEPERLDVRNQGITSPDGRVLGKMGHTERYSPFVGRNIYGEKYQPIFANGVKYFK